MKKFAVAAAVVALLIAAQGSSLMAAETETLKGQFVWNNGDQAGDVEAVFTPTGKNMWDVAFHFTWEGEPHTYSGTAEGNLKKGDLSGHVETDGEQKGQFVFKGQFKDGTFEGTHAGMRDGEERPTGTITLSR